MHLITPPIFAYKQINSSSILASVKEIYTTITLFYSFFWNFYSRSETVVKIQMVNMTGGPTLHRVKLPLKLSQINWCHWGISLLCSPALICIFTLPRLINTFWASNTEAHWPCFIWESVCNFPYRSASSAMKVDQVSYADCQHNSNFWNSALGLGQGLSQMLTAVGKIYCIIQGLHLLVKHVLHQAQQTMFCSPDLKLELGFLNVVMGFQVTYDLCQPYERITSKSSYLNSSVPLLSQSIIC